MRLRGKMMKSSRAQFYILSVVIIVLTIVAFATGILENSPAPFTPKETSFILNNLQTEAEQAFIIGKQRGTLESTFKKFTETTEYELAKERVSLKWEYAIQSSKIDVDLTIKTSDTIVQDSWTIS